jgi:hypothetical protein
VLRSEISEIFSGGQSILIYQHFPHEERAAFIRRMAASLRADTGASSVGCFQTSNVAFLLVCRPEHEMRLVAASNRLSVTWHDQIRPSFNPDL